MKELARQLYKSDKQMELKEFLSLTELERVTLLIELKDMQGNKELGRDEFLDKYFNFSNNIQRYIKTVGGWDGTVKTWYRYIDKVMEYRELYPELNQTTELVTTIEDNIDNFFNISEENLEKLLNNFTKKILNKQKESNLLENLKKIRDLESIKNPKSEEDLPKLISSKIPVEAIQILIYFKKKYGLKKQEIITLALLEFKEKYKDSL